jgi:hypothetical protein
MQTRHDVIVELLICLLIDYENVFFGEEKVVA